MKWTESTLDHLDRIRKSLNETYNITRYLRYAFLMVRFEELGDGYFLIHGNSMGIVHDRLAHPHIT